MDSKEINKETNKEISSNIREEFEEIIINGVSYKGILSYQEVYDPYSAKHTIRLSFSSDTLFDAGSNSMYEIEIPGLCVIKKCIIYSRSFISNEKNMFLYEFVCGEVDFKIDVVKGLDKKLGE